MVHINDWQTGLVPALILQQRRAEGWGNPPPTCLTIHNLAYQGIFPPGAFALTNLPGEFFTIESAEFYGQLNCLKAGIAFADAITTVSPRYAREIMTEEFGCALDGLLRQRQNRLFGILNGVDHEEWNPATDPLLPQTFSARRLAGKTACKLALQNEMGLPETADTPLFGTISRLAEQKGVDIQLGALEEMLSTDIQFVQLGSGSSAYERGYYELARRFPSKVAVRVGYDEGLAHRIEAGCDFYLMPSRFEPSGLNQMYSLCYGTIPIVRAVGGLDDSVIDFSQDAARANGIKFHEYSSRALAKAIRKALALYQHPDLLQAFPPERHEIGFLLGPDRWRISESLRDHKRSALNQIGKTAGAFGDGSARVVHLPRRVPQDVKFKVRRHALMGPFELLKAREHDLLRSGQCDLGVCRIAARPKFGPDLKTGNFAARPDGTVVIAAFNHGKRGPPVHGRRSCRRGTNPSI